MIKWLNIYKKHFCTSAHHDLPEPVAYTGRTGPVCCALGADSSWSALGVPSQPFTLGAQQETGVRKEREPCEEGSERGRKQANSQWTCHTFQSRKKKNFLSPFSPVHMFPYDLLWTQGVLNIRPRSQLRVRVLHACRGSHSQHARDRPSS